MKILWTSQTPALEGVTLGDDSVKHGIVLEQLGAASLLQATPLFRGANPSQIPRTNVSGQVGFTAAKSHADRAAALTFYAQERARLNQQGSLELRDGDVILTFDNAVLTAVQVADIIGVRWTLRYVFSTTTMEASV